MKKSKLLSIILISLLTFSCLLVGCSSKDQELKKLSVAEVTHSAFYAPQYVAMAKGFFEKQGLKIDLVNTQGADKTMAALLSNEVQIGLMGPEASIYVYNQGNNNYAVNFAQLTQKDGSFLISRTDEKNFSWDSLKGKEIIGGRKGGVPEMTLEYVLKKNNLNIGTNTANKDVNVRTDIQFAVMAGAFSSGQGDYVTLFDPAATQLQNQGNAYIVASIGKECGTLPYTCYSATKDYLSQNKDTVQKFTNAIYEGQLWVKSHSPEEIAKVIQPFFNDLSYKDLVTVVKRYQSIDAWSSTPTLEKSSLDLLMDIMNTANELDKKPPYEKIVTTEFAKKSIESIK